MVTRRKFSKDEIGHQSPYFSALKTTIETAFYANHVSAIKSMEEAYQLAASDPGSIVLDIPVIHTGELGLPSYARVLLSNSGAIVGRTAKARRIFGQNPDEDKVLLPIIRSAIFQSQQQQFYKADAIVGLDEDFMVCAHLMVPETEVANLYSWLLNFQIINEEYKDRLKQSKVYNENDIYIFFNPKWKHPDYPDGLAYFDTVHNCVIVLGLNYFGELKKATLTLAWGIAARNGFVSCHGGLKIFKKTDGLDYVASFFGLSGSGKSTLTHAKHKGKYDIKVLHDDAFVVSQSNGSSIALEPAYFDKTNDYPAGHPEQDFFVSVQNCGVTLDENGRKKLVTEDIRNGNGRTVKSRFSTPNRVDKIAEPIQAIYWIMKDDSLPPLIKVDDPVLAATMGCTLMTKRSAAENTKENYQSLVIEPYANPFRVYPLVEDYQKFQTLFESGVDCYILNTGFYMGKSIPKEVTLNIIEQVVDGTANFKAFGEITYLSYLELPDYPLAAFDDRYKQLLRERMQLRLNFLLSFNQNNLLTPLPVEAISRLEDLIIRLKNKT
ncbi:phosphoenolpyruvate carboxykinase (ATP) [Streptococcus minor]|uniref:phosphoenolpyruvate carboxykinase (ATP) n=1 Tax=Streptococcus minor TaxID=229549 RepID=UPI00037E54A4|nr:phosphoenolpyruvate carboxykinase (ATP) [Streptococcus minor]